MKKLISFRLSEEVLNIIKRQKGSSLTQKVENIVRFSTSFDQKRQLAELELKIKNAEKSYRNQLNRCNLLSTGYTKLYNKFNL